MHSARQAKAVSAEMRKQLELARDAWAEARGEGQVHVAPFIGGSMQGRTMPICRGKPF